MTLGLEHLEDVQEYVEAIVKFSGETGGGAFEWHLNMEPKKFHEVSLVEIRAIGISS